MGEEILGELLGDDGFAIISVEAGDVIDGDFFWAGGFAFVLVGAVPEAFCVHLADHGEGAFLSLGLALGEVAEVGDFCGDEEHGGGVFT